MWIISRKRLKRFWKTSEGRAAEGPLAAWYEHVSNHSVSWSSWGAVKADFATASIVGNCIVFNIGGNIFRLVTRVFYRSRKMYVLKVMTHKEYDQGHWKDECGCFSPPPRSKPQ